MYGGRFVLVERVGAGGMAEVWKAERRGRAGFIALKRILPEHAHDADFRRMFMQEARICARLDHPNLVRVYDSGESGGECWLAMELIEGKSFYEVIIGYLRRHQRPPPPGLSAYVVERLCRGLQHAHALTDEAGRPLLLVHRDVSPGNVMLAYDGEVKLLDFGVAKLLADHEGRTQAGVVKGKSGYMAPERLAELPIDRRADLFSAGVFLYEALSGKRLFPGAAPGTVVDTLFDEAVEAPPSRHNREVPPALDAICRRALARHAEDRFPDGESMAAALHGVVLELGWDAGRAAQALRELFEVPDPLTATAARRQPRRILRWALPAATAAALGVWLLMPVEKPAVPVETPAPVEEKAPPVEEKTPPVEVKTLPVEVKTLPVEVKAPAPLVKEKRKRTHRTHPARRGPHPLDDSDLASPF